MTRRRLPLFLLMIPVLLVAVQAMEPDDWVYAHELVAADGDHQTVLALFLLTKSQCRQQTNMSPDVGQTLPRRPDGGPLTVTRNECTLIRTDRFFAQTREAYGQAVRIDLPKRNGFVVFAAPSTGDSLVWCRNFVGVLEGRYEQDTGSPVELRCQAM